MPRLRSIALATMLLVEPALAGSPSSGLDLSLRGGVGQVDYRESVRIAPTRSAWDADYAGFSFSATIRPVGSLVLRGEGSLGTSSRETETWTDSGDVVQRNQLELSAFDLLGEAGWELGSSRFSIRPLAGLGLRSHAYRRSRFVLADAPEVRLSGTVTEDVSVLSLHAGFAMALEPDRAAGRPFGFSGSVRVGWPAYSSADNSLFGEIDGEGGLLADADLMLLWQAAPMHRFGLGLRYDYQQLDGDIKAIPAGRRGFAEDGLLEWPDNRLERVLFIAEWVYRI